MSLLPPLIRLPPGFVDAPLFVAVSCLRSLSDLTLRIQKGKHFDRRRWNGFYILPPQLRSACNGDKLRYCGVMLCSLRSWKYASRSAVSPVTLSTTLSGFTRGLMGLWSLKSTKNLGWKMHLTSILSNLHRNLVLGWGVSDVVVPARDELFSDALRIFCATVRKTS